MTTMLEKAARAVTEARAYPGSKPPARASDVDRRVALAVLHSIRPRDGEDLPLKEIMARKYLDAIIEGRG